MKQWFSQNKTKSHLFGEYRCAPVTWIWATSGLAVPDSRNEKSWLHLWIQRDGTEATVWLERGFVARPLCHSRTIPKIRQNQITLSSLCLTVGLIRFVRSPASNAYYDPRLMTDSAAAWRQNCEDENGPFSRLAIHVSDRGKRSLKGILPSSHFTRE